MADPKHPVRTTDAEIEAALKAARVREKKEGSDPYATRVEYLESSHILVISLSNELRIAIPVENLQGLENASPQQLRNYEMMGIGFAFRFPDLDADFHVDALIEGVYGSRKWMAEIGKRGGCKPERKQHASRAKSRKLRKERVPA